MKTMHKFLAVVISAALAAGLLAGCVLHHHDLCALAAHGAGGVGAGFQHGIQCRLL